MSLRAGIGFSFDNDAVAAAQEAAMQVKQQLGEDPINLSFVFNTLHYHPKDFLPALTSIIPGTIFGASTSGIVFADEIKGQGICVVGIHGEYLRFRGAQTNHLNLQNLRVAGKTLAKDSSPDFSVQHQQQYAIYLLFIDGMLSDVSQFLAGMEESFGNRVPILGAKCDRDDGSLSSTIYQFTHNRIFRHGAIGLLLGGIVNLAWSCRQGCQALGRPRMVTRSEGNVIHTIDDKPAIELYATYFQRDASSLRNGFFDEIRYRYPLGLRIGEKHYLLRNAVRTGEGGTIVCDDGIPPGSEIHIMIGNSDTHLKAAKEAAQDVRIQLKGKKPQLILMFHSAVRHRMIGRTAAQEIKAIKDILGENVPLAGMHTGGEIIPIKIPNQKVDSFLQNDSLILMALA